jgi:putative hemolysin
VGEIEDEHDVGETRGVQRFADGSLLVDALIPVNDLEKLLQVDLGDFLPYYTLAGLILDRLGRFPEKGEKLEWQDFLLTCEEVTETAILKAKIRRLAKPVEDQQPPA